jgi:spermidine/putrescine transport system substrate-binding protein
VQASAPGQYNVFLATDQFNYKRYSDLGYATQLDEAKIPNLKNCAPATVDAFRKFSPGGKLSAVPYVYSVAVYSYNTKHIPKGSVDENSHDALIDPKFKGKVVGDQNWATRIWIAAQQSGQDPNNIKDMKPIWDNIRKSKELVLKYYSSGAEQMNLFANEEAWIGDTWAGRAAVLKRQGKPLETVAPPGSRFYIGNMYVLKGSPMDEAHELLNFMLEPHAAIAVSQAMAYPTVIDPTRFKLPEDITSLAGFDPAGKFEKVVFQDPVYWNQNALEWQKQFQRTISR